MTTLVRRVAPVAVSLAAVFAVALPGSAVAKSKVETDQLGHCEGANVEGLGSTFQASAEFLWDGTKYPEDGFNVSKSSAACGGEKKPTVFYNNTKEEYKGSGNCLKDMGSAGEGSEKINSFEFCGTDEAPSASVKEAMEKTFGLSYETNKGDEIQSIPVLQGAVAVIVHLPAGCTAESEPVLNKKATKIGRLSLEKTVVAEIYEGKITTWKKAIAANKSANDKMTCSPEPSEEAETIHPVVRLDKSGTTHIFKSFLEQVGNTSEEFEMEEFGNINEKSAGKEDVDPCNKEVLKPEKKTWKDVAEGCENQRWPAAAHVTRGIETGNPGVIKTVTETASSIGYADVAVAREKAEFSAKGKGGEGLGKFWVPVSNSKEGSKKVEYAEPTTNGDVEALGNSNCVKTVYAAEVGEKVPPESTRDDWSKVKGLAVSKTYAICGLTYALAPRLYKPWLTKFNAGETLTEAQKVATTVSNYLVWVLNEKTEGGGAEVEGHDYEPLPKKVQKIAEAGALEIGAEKA